MNEFTELVMRDIYRKNIFEKFNLENAEELATNLNDYYAENSPELKGMFGKLLDLVFETIDWNYIAECIIEDIEEE